MEIDGFNIPNHMVPWDFGLFFFSFEVLILQWMFFVVHSFNCSRLYTQVLNSLTSAPVGMNDGCCSIALLRSAIQGKKWWLFPSQQCFFFWAQRESLSVARPPDAPLPLIQLWISPECSLAAEWLNECMVKSPLVAAPHNFCSLNSRHWCCCLIRRHLFHCSVVRLWSTVTCGHISKRAFAAVKALGING